MSDCKVSIVCGVVRKVQKAMLNAYGEVASGSVEAVCTTILRAIGDSCPIAK